MPLIQVKVIEGVFTPDQKHEIVRDLTDALVRVEGEAMRPVTWCVIEEVRSGDWGTAGNVLTTANILIRLDQPTRASAVAHAVREGLL